MYAKTLKMRAFAVIDWMEINCGDAPSGSRATAED
jgi:hypothetical protein